MTKSEFVKKYKKYGITPERYDEVKQKYIREQHEYARRVNAFNSNNRVIFVDDRCFERKTDQDWFVKEEFDIPIPVKMTDELTTVMHADFMEGEMTELQLRCFAAYAQMARGKSKEDALKANHLTEKEYDDNIQAALEA